MYQNNKKIAKKGVEIFCNHMKKVHSVDGQAVKVWADADIIYHISTKRPTLKNGILMQGKNTKTLNELLEKDNLVILVFIERNKARSITLSNFLSGSIHQLGVGRDIQYQPVSRMATEFELTVDEIEELSKLIYHNKFDKNQLSIDE